MTSNINPHVINFDPDKMMFNDIHNKILAIYKVMQGVKEILGSDHTAELTRLCSENDGLRAENKHLMNLIVNRRVK